MDIQCRDLAENAVCVASNLVVQGSEEDLSSNTRTLTIPADKVYELYHQNPEFGFHMVRLITERLTRDIRRLEGQVAAEDL